MMGYVPPVQAIFPPADFKALIELLWIRGSRTLHAFTARPFEGFPMLQAIRSKEGAISAVARLPQSWEACRPVWADSEPPGSLRFQSPAAAKPQPEVGSSRLRVLPVPKEISLQRHRLRGHFRRRSFVLSCRSRFPLHLREIRGIRNRRAF